MLALSMTSTAPGKWIAEFLPVAEPHATKDCMDALEMAMKRGPVDVFWFQERWKANFRGGLTISQWLGAGGRCAKPHRGLLWLVNAPDLWSLPDSWRHPDVTYEVALADFQTLPVFMPPDTLIHRVPGSADQGPIHQALKAIDTANALPLDFILAPQAPKPLIRSGAIEQIPVVDIKSPDPS
jgi:hypothetical protein